jgi:hypothetical protein
MATQASRNLVSWLEERTRSDQLQSGFGAFTINRGHYGHPTLAWKSVDAKKQESHPETFQRMRA